MTSKSRRVKCKPLNKTIPRVCFFFKFFLSGDFIKELTGVVWPRFYLSRCTIHSTTTTVRFMPSQLKKLFENA